MGLFSSANKESQVGVDFLRDGIAIAQVSTGNRQPGSILRSEFVAASGEQAQVEALRQWVRSNHLQKTPCVCLIAQEDCDVYQVEKPEVDESELIQAVTWKIKDLVSYDVAEAVVDSYPMPVPSNNKQQVGVVAAHETVVSDYVERIRSSALALNALDIHELARSNLGLVRQTAESSLALLSFDTDAGLLGIYHDADLYLSREFNIGIDKLGAAGTDDESVYDALLLEIQRSLDYFESFYGIGSVNDLRIFPRHPAVEKMVMYLQNLTNYDFDFVAPDGGEGAELNPHCFHAYCAALRGIAA